MGKCQGTQPGAVFDGIIQECGCKAACMKTATRMEGKRPVLVEVARKTIGSIN